MRTLARLLAHSLLLLVVALPAHAEDKGSITGKVADKRTGHALPFANVAVVGAQKGGLTDSEGRFSIPGVPVGTYEVRVQFLGYKAESRPGVSVAAGKPVALEFKLEEVVVRQEKVVEITAERRLVEAKQGATVRSVTANDIRNLPVTTISDVLQQQAGISTDADQIHVRGGRADETMFVVNGVANRDLVTGQSTAGQLNARSVSEVSVNTGAFDVRFGNALSGIVEIRLKEGTEKRQFGVTTSAGSYGGRAWQALVSGPDPVWTPLLRAAGIQLPGTLSSVLDVSGSLFETRFSYLGHPGLSVIERSLIPPFLHPRLVSSYEDRFLGIKFKYPSMWGPAQDNRWAARYGLSWKPNNVDKLSFNFAKRIAIDQGFSRTFLNAQGDQGDPAYPWRWDHRIGNAPTIFEDNVQTSLEWKRSLARSGFTSLQLSRYYFAQRQDVQGKHWSEYQEPDDRSLFPLGDPRRDDYFYDSGDDNQWADRRTNSWGLQGSVTQRAGHNELEVGFDHQWQSVQYITIENPWVFDRDGLGQSHDLWDVHPMVGAFYGRDRLEFEGFVANFGVRADYWFLGREAEQAMGDTTRNVAPTTRTSFFGDTRSFFGRRVKMHLSPRVIVAHPITEHSSFFFNYGEFTQNPSYRYVYSKLNSISSESFPLQGNPNLNPQVSVNYEVGGKHQFLPTTAANVTFFVRDVYDYPSATRVDPLSGTNLQSYFVYLNGHYARSKGFEVEVEKRRSNHWAGKLSYSYQQTRGKSSDPNEERALQEVGGSSETRLSEEYVRWNRPSKLTGSLDVRFDEKAPFAWARRTGFNMYVQGQSGRAYTPLDIFAQNPIGLPNSRNARVQYLCDMKLNRWFKLGTRRFDVSFSGTNVFSNHVFNRIDAITGLGRVWGAGEYDPANVSGLNDFTRVSQVDDPSNYGPGAQWRLQLDVDL